MKVSVAIALPGRQEVIELELDPGATLADAIAAARLAERFPGVDFAAMRAGIWSHRARRFCRGNSWPCIRGAAGW